MNNRGIQDLTAQENRRTSGVFSMRARNDILYLITHHGATSATFHCLLPVLLLHRALPTPILNTPFPHLFRAIFWHHKHGM